METIIANSSPDIMNVFGWIFFNHNEATVDAQFLKFQENVEKHKFKTILSNVY